MFSGNFQKNDYRI